ncbi:hypothetical protein GDO81_026350 [Engystomops pustulosus]|uniref:Uncharacterized protein n=1 Tax=Engystomops pustulosus TaxID=76066 RepID=A0AAV6YME5_ENGPU|nr:hypothetical protein GDO81_026350 [Engystomops pustulosus]
MLSLRNQIASSDTTTSHAGSGGQTCAIESCLTTWLQRSLLQDGCGTCSNSQTFHIQNLFVSLCNLSGRGGRIQGSYLVSKGQHVYIYEKLSSHRNIFLNNI